VWKYQGAGHLVGRYGGVFGATGLQFRIQPSARGEQAPQFKLVRVSG
jgi:hypothetical protein